MGRQTKYSAFSLWLSELWDEPSAKVIAGGIVIAVVAITLFAVGPTRARWDFWNSEDLGPGWECTYPGKGAKVCIRDVPAALQKSNPGRTK